MKKFRPTAIPLATVDPYFSIWSFNDKLNDGVTRHWSGKKSSMTGILEVDGEAYLFMGSMTDDEYMLEPKKLEQESVKVYATKTVYEFKNEQIFLELTFRTPLLADNLYLMSRPVSYISYKVKFSDGKKHNAKISIDICAEICMENKGQKSNVEYTSCSLSCGKAENNEQKYGADMVRADWGKIHISAKGGKYFARFHKACAYARDKLENADGVWFPNDGNVYIGVDMCYDDTDEFSDFVCIAYEDKYPIELFGEKLEAYWCKNGETIEDVINKAIAEYEDICKKCDAFDEALIRKASKVSPKYADILNLVYRQVISAHVLCEKDGELMFFSKECGSNGCIATVDITYPSMPMFLLYNADLLEGMLNPIFEYTENNHGWEYEFAPHDIGIYPLANGQQYDDMRLATSDDPSGQMPIEECGNMILCTAALCKIRNDHSYAAKHRETLSKWANYLKKCGYDPEYQLCTDDFGGNLAHNSNLAVKGILAVAAWGVILNKLGQDGGEYITTAKEYAKKWKEAAFDSDHYSLTYDRKNTWSIKYNLVWDKILDLNVFDKEIFDTEVQYYKTKINKYGLPLDSREDYTKSDWQLWSTCLTNGVEYRDMIINAMWELVCDIDYRVPFSDWYCTSEPKIKGFQARSVQGALFLPLIVNNDIQ